MGNTESGKAKRNRTRTRRDCGGKRKAMRERKREKRERDIALMTDQGRRKAVRQINNHGAFGRTAPLTPHAVEENTHLFIV